MQRLPFHKTQTLKAVAADSFLGNVLEQLVGVAVEHQVSHETVKKALRDAFLKRAEGMPKIPVLVQ